jgi:hypothetical protein
VLRVAAPEGGEGAGSGTEEAAQAPDDATDGSSACDKDGGPVATGDGYAFAAE